MSTYVIIDGDNLCHRNWHAMNSSSFAGAGAKLKHPVIFGMLRDILFLRGLFNPDQFIFTFDHGESLRKQVYPGYKSNREPHAGGLQKEIALLKFNVLPDIGYRNVFFQEGYEADDIMAMLTKEVLLQLDSKILVSNDSDMFQLLTTNVSIWSPNVKRVLDAAFVKNKYGIPPKLWVDMKSISGCGTDAVVGVPGVGDKTALKWILGTLPTTSISYDRIAKSSKRIAMTRNIIELPFNGLSGKKFRIKEDSVTQKKWDQVCLRYDCRKYITRSPL